MSDLPAVAAQTLAQDSHLESHPSTAPPVTSFDAAYDFPDIDHPSPTTPRRRSHRRKHSTDPTVLEGGTRPRAHLPPLPDLRFEQSYLASIAPAEGDIYKIVLITLRDQVLFPLMQGTLFSLGVVGWRAWNGKARFLGMGLGARIRRWWWGVNKWPIPRK